MKPTALFICLTFVMLIQAQTTRFDWAKHFSGGKSMANCVKTDAAGNVYTSGIFTGEVDFDAGPGVSTLVSRAGHYDLFVCKLDAGGNLLWAIDLLSVGDANVMDTAIGWQFGRIAVQPTTGEVFVTGNFTGTVDMDPGPATLSLTAPPGEAATFVCKFTTDGKTSWAKLIAGQKTYWYQHNNGMGITHYFRYNWNYQLAADAGGNVIVAGYFDGKRDFNPGAATHYLTGSSINTDNTGSLGGGGIFILKLNANGEYLWATTPTITAPHYYPNNPGAYGYAELSAMCIDPSGKVYCTGVVVGTADFDPSDNELLINGNGWSHFLWKLNTDGSLNLARALPYDTTGYIRSIVADTAGALFTAGSLYDFWYDTEYGAVTKLDTAGNRIWSKNLFSTSYNKCNYPAANTVSICLDASGNVVTAGYYWGPVDFDPGPEEFYLNQGDLFVLSLSAGGKFQWVRQLKGNVHNTYFSGFYADIAITPTSKIYTTSFVSGPPGEVADLHHGAGQFTVPLTGTPINRWNGVQNAFVHKMSKCTGSTSSALTVTSCSNYKLNDYVYTKSGTYHQVIPNEEGCDSLITLQLTINRQYVYRDVYVESCLPYEWACHQDRNSCQTVCKTVQQTGVYTDTLAAFTACDTIVRLHFTRLPPLQTTVTVSICSGRDYLGYTASGTYIDRFKTAAGCDSIRTLQLTILPAIRSTITQTICQGKSYEGHTTTGTYVDSLKTANGCDSLRVLQLTVLPPIRSNVVQTICHGQNYLGYTATGTYTDTFKTAGGCDSVRTLQLTVLPALSTTISKTICKGQSWEGYTASGIYTDTFTGANGCDSTRKLQLTVESPPLPNLGPDVVLCEGETLILKPDIPGTYGWQDGSAQHTFTVTAPGLYWVNITNSCGAGKDEINVGFKTCGLYFPSAFTPNNDGKNDEFKLLGSTGSIESYQLRVFNRWGQLLFETANAAKGWNGTLQGRHETSGVYVWYCRYKIRGTSATIEKKGTVLLTR